MMMKRAAGCVLLGLLFFPVFARADSFFSNGRVHNTCGTRSDVLFYRDFKLTPDGRITGYIVNKSDRPVRGLALDMYTMDRDEMRVYWSKTIVIGDIPPNGRYHVDEPYHPAFGATDRVVFRFKIHGGDEYKVPEIKE